MQITSVAGPERSEMPLIFITQYSVMSRIVHKYLYFLFKIVILCITSYLFCWAFIKEPLCSALVTCILSKDTIQFGILIYNIHYC